MEIKELYSLYKRHYKVTTDTRSDMKDCIFFALKGANFNGNLYAKEALDKGANYAVVDEKKYQTHKNIILVEEVLQTLQLLAKYHREQLNIPVIALTGSNGKTTTKELIHAVLKEKFLCAATKGNLNNHIGVPLTLLYIKPGTEIAVIEMGANHPKEIEMLCNIALPDYGYITNFGKVHLEGFKSLEGVIEAKTEMYAHLRKHHKKVFINSNDKVQVERSKGMRIISFGSDTADYPVQFVKANPFVQVRFEHTELHSKLIGKYNFMNIAAAIAIGSFFGVGKELIVNGVEQYVPSNNRSQIIVKGDNKIILDAYNANPNSMEVALKNLSQLTDKRKIAILGDMFEIGENNMLEHQNIVDLISKLSIDRAILIGASFSKTVKNNPNMMQYSTFEAFKNGFDKEDISAATILIKASRGMALERVLDIL